MTRDPLPSGSPPAVSVGQKVGPTLADVLAKLESLSDLDPVRRRDLASSVRRVAELLGRDPVVVPADLGALKTQVTRLSPAKNGLSPKTIVNLKSNVIAALKLTGFSRMPASRSVLTPAWARMFAALPDKRLRNGLSRFMRFCSAMGLEPARVNDGVVESFIETLETNTFVTRIKEARRRTTRLWNEAADTVPGWPPHHLSVPDQRKPRESMPLVAFPASFQADVERYSAWLGDNDPFAEPRPPRPNRPSTIRQVKLQIELGASILVRSGHDIATFTSLADLVEVEAVKTILRHYVQKGSPFARSLATMLVGIARHWVRVDPDRLDRLKDLRRRLGPQPSGLTDKNRTALRQFDDDGNRRLLLLLPDILFREALARDDGSVRPAVKAQVALAIEILLSCPVRMGNLIGLRLDRHIVRPGGPRGTVFLVLAPEEVKNDEPVEYELPRQLVDMLDGYIDDFRPRLLGNQPEPNPHLFPSRAGACKAKGTLAQQIVGTIRKRTGLILTPHQFRHLAAKLFLAARPGAYEAVRHLLHHKSMKTTTGFYTGLQTGPAAKLYDDLLLKERERLRAIEVSPRRRTRGVDQQGSGRAKALRRLRGR